MVAPIADAPSGGGTKLLVGLVVLVAVGAIAFAMLSRDTGDDELAQAGAAPTSEEAAEIAEEAVEEAEEEAEEAEEALAEAAEEAEEAEVAAEEAAEEVAEAESAEAVAASAQAAAERPRTGSTGSSASSAAPSSASAMTAEPAPTAMEEAPAPTPTMEAEEPAPTGMSSVEDLLDRAIGGNAPAPTMEAPAEMEAAPANLPETPSRASIARALGGLTSRMRQCAGDQVGLATARIRVSNDGQVQTANIGGSPFGGTPQGACMENVVKTARFPRFSRPYFDVTYPFSIRPLN